MSTVAIFLALGGTTAFAASQLGRHSVGTVQLKADAGTGAKVRDGSLPVRHSRRNRRPALPPRRVSLRRLFVTRDGKLRAAGVQNGEVVSLDGTSWRAGS